LTELAIEPVDGFENVSTEWVKLAERSENIFASLEWVSTWWSHFGRDRRLLVTTCSRAGGPTVAILPLYLAAARPVRTIRFLGHGPADQLGPICDVSEREAAASALNHALAERCPPWDLFIADQLPGNEGWSESLGGRTLKRESSPVLRFEGMDWEQFLGSRSSNFRQQVRRRERKLAREHQLQFRLTRDRDGLEGDLELLFRLHEAQGHEAFSGPLRDFHREFAGQAFDRGWLRLWVMEVDDRPVAAWYGFRFGGVESYYQAGRDPDWDRYSVGFVLLVHSMREACNDGMREYRLLRGDEEYKKRFAGEDPGLETVGLGRTALGRAAIVGAAAARSFPRPAKRLVSRLGG
jgi:CelD/BcsL family acetyltransferase involved in cellulose biosynthesis